MGKFTEVSIYLTIEKLTPIDSKQLKAHLEASNVEYNLAESVKAWLRSHTAGRITPYVVGVRVVC